MAGYGLTKQSSVDLFCLVEQYAFLTLDPRLQGWPGFPSFWNLKKAWSDACMLKISWVLGRCRDNLLISGQKTLILVKAKRNHADCVKMKADGSRKKGAILQMECLYLGTNECWKTKNEWRSWWIPKMIMMFRLKQTLGLLTNKIYFSDLKVLFFL